jgi:multiple sugar transport system substrate-binding protein
LKRSWKSIVSIIVAVLLCGLMMTACAQKGGDTQEPAQNGSDVTEPTPAPEKVTIKFWKYQDENEQATIEALVDKFNSESTTTNVVFEAYPWEQYTGEKITSSIAGGVGPDVFWLSAGDFIKYVANDLLLPLNDAFLPEYQEDFLPNSLKAVSVGDNIYGVPHEMGVSSLIYDKKLFDEKGIEPPKDWDELLTIARELKTDTRWGLIIPTNPDVFQNFIWYSWLWSAGGEVLDEGWTKARINEPEGVAALQLWGTLIEEGLASPKGGAAFDADVAQGKAAMASLGHWVADNFTQNYPDFELGVAPIPPREAGGKSLAAYGGWFSVVNAATEHPDEAKEFAVWLFGKDPENAIELLKPPGTYLSPRKSVMEAVQQTEYYQQYPHPLFIESIWPNTRPEPAYPPEIVTAVTEALQEVMFGGVSAQDAADHAAQKINDYLATPDAQKIREMLQ